MSRRGEQSRVAVLVLAFAVLGGGLPIALVAAVPDVGRSSAWPLTLGVMVWAGVRLSVLCADGHPRLFDYFFWIFTYIFMGLAPTVQIRADLVSTTTPGVDPSLDVPAALVVVLGIAMYEVGRLVAASGADRSEVPPIDGLPLGVGSISAGRTVILVVVGLLATAYLLLSTGAGSLWANRVVALSAREVAWPDPTVRSIVLAVARYPLLVGAGALTLLRRAESNPAVRRASLVGLAVAISLVVITTNPINSARYPFGTAAFAIAVYLGAVRTAARARATMVATAVGFLFAFPLADAFRRADGVRAQRGGFFAEYLSNPDYDAFWQIANAYAYAHDGYVQPLRQLAGSLLFWVPRVIWPSKPVDTSILLAQYRGYQFDNLSAPLWAEALVNGGVVGVVLTFVLLGYFLRRFDARLPGAFRLGGFWGIAGAIFPVYMTILLRGSLLQATGSLFVLIACLLFTRERRTSSVQPEYSDSS